jgi:hypothetical protein
MTGVAKARMASNSARQSGSRSMEHSVKGTSWRWNQRRASTQMPQVSDEYMCRSPGSASAATARPSSAR